MRNTTVRGGVSQVYFPAHVKCPVRLAVKVIRRRTRERTIEKLYIHINIQVKKKTFKINAKIVNVGLNED